MNLSMLIKKSEKLLRSNSPVILTTLGVTGIISTAYLSWCAGYEIGYDEGVNSENLLNEFPLKERFKRLSSLHWKRHIPAVAMGTVTIACVVGANRISSRKAAALTAAYSLSEKAFTEYKEKVVEVIGKNKEQKIRDDLTKEKILNNPPSEKQIIVSGDGHVLCCELHTGRYFISNMESLRKAENDLNAHLVRHGFAYLDDFYYLIDLDNTTNSSIFGWESEKLLELEYSTHLAKDGVPCIAFEYNYLKSIK